MSSPSSPREVRRLTPHRRRAKRAGSSSRPGWSRPRHASFGRACRHAGPPWQSHTAFLLPAHLARPRRKISWRGAPRRRAGAPPRRWLAAIVAGRRESSRPETELLRGARALGRALGTPRGEAGFSAWTGGRPRHSREGPRTRVPSICCREPARRARSLRSAEARREAGGSRHRGGWDRRTRPPSEQPARCWTPGFLASRHPPNLLQEATAGLEQLRMLP